MTATELLAKDWNFEPESDENIKKLNHDSYHGSISNGFQDFCFLMTNEASFKRNMYLHCIYGERRRERHVSFSRMELC